MVVVPSAAATETAAGQREVLSKWPQKPLASIASQKQISKMAQLVPVLSSLGTEEGRVSERGVAVMDMVSTRCYKYRQGL